MISRIAVGKPALLVSISLLMLLLISAAPLEAASTSVCGVIASDTTWTLSASPYVATCDVVVNAGITLTVEPGVVVKFQTLYVDLIVNGTLLAQGTQVSPIVFTSYRDDAHGGDTNDDLNATLPAKADWGGIALTASSSGSLLEYTWIGYGGYGGIPYAYANLYLYTSDATVQNNTIAYSSNFGILVRGVDPAYPLVLTGNTFLNNTQWAVLDEASGKLTDITLTGNTSSGSGNNGFGLKGPIIGTVTYSSQPTFPFIVWDSLNDPSVEAGSTLTFSPGTVVKFASGRKLTVNGQLIAQGTEAEPVVFTSWRDDAHGGDTNGDGNATLPARGDWSGIALTASSSGSLLEYTWIGYGGYGGIPYAYANLYLYTSDLTLQNNTIAYSSNYGIRVSGVNPAYPLVLTGNTFLNNTQWAVFDEATGTLTDIMLSGNTSSGSANNGFGLKGPIIGTLTYSSQPVFPFISDSRTDLSVEAGSSLTFSPGTVVKFTSNRKLTVNGRLLAQGTVAEPVVFTSWRDDAHGGDSNGDGATSPLPGDWGGIALTASSSGSILDHTWIGYGGYGSVPYGYANLYLFTSDATVQNSTIAWSGNRGIHVDNALPRIESNWIQDNRVGIYCLNGAQPRVRDNLIEANSQYGVQNADAGIQLDAGHNWWGAASGPFHTIANPAGTGNPVSDNVTFNPWYSAFEWRTPFSSVFHGLQPLSWGAFGSTAGTSVILALRGAGDWQILGSNLPPNGSLDWNSTSVPDGWYDLRIQLFDAGAQLLAERIRKVLVLNAAGIVWHSGSVVSDETWPSGVMHLVGPEVTLASGITLTVAPGAIVKFAPDSGLIIPSGAILNAYGTSAAPIVFTSLADDSVGGDTNLDGTRSLPQPGDWLGLGIRGSGQANLNEYTQILYALLQHSGTLTEDATWSNDLLHVVSGDVTVPTGVRLTIGPGAIVKFADKRGLTIQSGGQLDVQGSVAQPVVFTSIRDDSAGGDSNADGDATLPAAGDWRWIYLDSGSAAIDHAVIAYGGGNAAGSWNSTGALRTNGSASLTVDNSVIRQAFYDGVLALGGPVTIRNSVVSGADRGICANTGSAVTVLNTTVVDNRIGLLLHGGSLVVTNSIISHSSLAGILHDYGTDSLTIRYSDVWNPGATNYSGTADRTGQNGNKSADPLYINLGLDNFRPGYLSPAIDAADGPAAPVTDRMGAPRYDDPRTPNTGLPTTGGAYADMGAYEFVETASSNINLVVTEVVGPAQARAGESAILHWTVANLGSEQASGPWHDTLALGSSEMPTPTLLVAAQVLSGVGVTLSPGETVQLEATLRVPGGELGDYFWYVQTNSGGEVFEGQNHHDNLGHSVATVALDVPELIVDGPAVARSFSTAGESHWFRFQAAVGQDIQISLDSQTASGAVELYLGGLIPTRMVYEQRSSEWNSPDASLIKADTFSQTYYLLAYPNALPGGSTAFSVQASLLDFSISSVSPNTVGTGGQVTLEITGGRLTSGVTFNLVAANGSRVSALQTSTTDSGRVYATFDLAGFPVGLADVEAVFGGATVTAPDAVQVQSGGDSEFYARLTGPSALRLGREGTWYITYGNRGSVDVALPLLKFSVSGAREMRIYQDVRNWADSIVFLALDPDTLLPTLGPGQEATIAVQVLPPAAGSSVEARLETITGEHAAADPTPFDWNTIPVPPGFDPVFWQAELDTFADMLGETVGEFYGVLLQDLDDLRTNRLPYTYVVNANGQWLLGPEIQAGPDHELSAGHLAPAVAPIAVESVDIKSAANLAETTDSKTFFVIVSVGDYQERPPIDPTKLLPDLTSAIGDYNDLLDFTQKSLRIPPSRLRTLVDPANVDPSVPDAPDVTKDNFFLKIRSLKPDIGPKDKVVVWFTGHGDVSEFGNSRLLLNAPGEQGEILPGELQAELQSLGAGQTYVVLDACFSGGFKLMDPDNTQLAGLYSSDSDSNSWAGDRSSRFTTELKDHLRQGEGLQEAFDKVDISITNAYKNRLPVDQQEPTMHKDTGMDLSGNPWRSYVPWGERLSNRLRQMATSAIFRLVSYLLFSADPNDKVGPAGDGLEAFVGFDPLLAYTIHFENMPSATAPAQEVVVTDVLAPTLDLSTFELDSIGFNDIKLDVPPGLDYFHAIVQVGSDPNPVNVTAELNYATRTVTWTMRSIDPLTGDLPQDPFAGFLPPNDSGHYGEGFISFRLRPVAGLAQGMEIHNQATIVFDVNPPIATNVTLHTLGMAPVQYEIFLPIMVR